MSDSELLIIKLCKQQSSPFFTFVWSYHFVSLQSMTSLPALKYLVRRKCKTPFHALYSRTTQWSIPIILKMSFPKSYWNLILESNLIEYADDRSLGWHQRLHFPRYYPPLLNLYILFDRSQTKGNFHFILILELCDCRKEKSRSKNFVRKRSTDL